MPRAIPHVLRDPGLLAALPVPGPLAGQVEPEVDQRVLTVGDVAEEDADLAVLDLSEPAAPLALHAHRGGPLLGEGRGVEHEHGVGPADRAGEMAGQFRDQRVMIPVDLADEPLDDLAIEVVAVGDRLGVLALDVGEQPGEIGPGMGAALGAGQRGGERPGEVLQPAHHAAEERGRDLTAGE